MTTLPALGKTGKHRIGRNLGWILFLAGRYFRTKRKEKGSISSTLSVAGIAVGVTALIAVLGVMNGFQLGFIESILEVSSYHLRIDPSEGVGADGSFGPEDAEMIRSLSGVRAVLPFLEVQTLGFGAYNEPQGLFVRGVPENAEEIDPGLVERLNPVRGSFDLSEPGSIVIGSELARALGVGVGDTVSLLAFGGGERRSLAGLLRTENVPFTVTGIFRSGYYLFDVSWAIARLDDAGRFVPGDGTPTWGVKLRDRYADARTASRILAALPNLDSRAIVSWREFNRAFFGALRTEKIMMMFLLGLIFLVVGVNIFHSLKRSVHERTEEIGVLRAVGAEPGAIRLVFVSEGFFIGLLGGLGGLVLGLLAAGSINEFFAVLEAVMNVALVVVRSLLSPFLPSGSAESVTFFSPMYFYLTEVPSRVMFSEALAVFLFAVLSSTGAAYFASRKVAVVKPADVLRYE